MSKVRYPTLKAVWRVGKKALTVEESKEILGWTYEKKGEDFGLNYVFVDHYGKKVRLLNNQTNRWLRPASVELLKQQHLMKRWRVNGEPLIIGREGNVLNGQHTLVSHVLAEQLRGDRQREKWSNLWKDGESVRLEKLVVYGVQEDNATVNTIDTGRARTLAEVIYRCKFFEKLSKKDQKIAARMADFCVRTLWSRVAADMDAFAPKRTHQEALDFIDRHPTIMDAVNHIFHLNRELNLIGRIVPPGRASAFLYLQGACRTDGQAYRSAVPRPSEEAIDWSALEDAMKFWEMLVKSKEFTCIQQAVGELDSVDGLHRGSYAEITAILVKAWRVFNGEDRIPTYDDLSLDYEEDECGVELLTSTTSFGGIDVTELEVEGVGLSAAERIALIESRMEEERQRKRKAELADREEYDDDGDEEESFHFSKKGR